MFCTDNVQNFYIYFLYYLIEIDYIRSLVFLVLIGYLFPKDLLKKTSFLKIKVYYDE